MSSATASGDQAGQESMDTLPEVEEGAAMVLPFMQEMMKNAQNNKPANSWKVSVDDNDDEEELIDDEELLDEEDLKRPDPDSLKGILIVISCIC